MGAPTDLDLDLPEFEIDSQRERSSAIFQVNRKGIILDYKENQGLEELLGGSTFNPRYLGEKGIIEVFGHYGSYGQEILQFYENLVEKNQPFDIHKDIEIVDKERKHVHVSGDRLASGNFQITISDETDRKEATRMNIRLEVVRNEISRIAQRMHDAYTAKDINTAENLSSYLGDMIAKSLDSKWMRNWDFGFDKREIKLYEEVIYPVQQMLGSPAIRNLEEVKGVQVYTDPLFLKAVYFNILDNAMKFGGKNTKIRIESAETNYKGRPINVISIINTESHIPESERQNIFKQYVKLDENSPGQGLGLYTAKAITRSLGGTLVLSKSEESKPTTFYIALPISKK